MTGYVLGMSNTSLSSDKETFELKESREKDTLKKYAAATDSLSTCCSAAESIELEAESCAGGFVKYEDYLDMDGTRQPITNI